MAKKELAKKAAVVRATTKEDKKTALDGALKQIEKKYGAGAIMRLGQTKTLNVDCIPTGSMTLDMALGIGGVPRGRIVEVYGPESSGKTTVALSIIAQAQKLGGEAAFIDVEHALDPVYAQALGVNIDELLVSQPDSGEQALEIAEALIRSGAIDVIVLDSIAAMTTRAEIDGEMGDLHVGQLARLMSQAMRKLTAAISEVKLRCYLHQPDTRKDRRYVRQSRNDPRRTRSQILLVRKNRSAQGRSHKVGQRYNRCKHQVQGGQEQGRSAFQGMYL